LFQGPARRVAAGTGKSERSGDTVEPFIFRQAQDEGRMLSLSDTKWGAPKHEFVNVMAAFIDPLA
jgi:hypothetical protein